MLTVMSVNREPGSQKQGSQCFFPGARKELWQKQMNLLIVNESSVRIWKRVNFL